jgi:pimeloyl-ACP methyl ester carboxylesterase
MVTYERRGFVEHHWRRAGDAGWAQYHALVGQSMARFRGFYRRQNFEYLHPDHLQPETPERFRKPYPVRVHYIEWGQVGKPILVCCGGVANVAQRFNYLALELMKTHHVVCMDWVGRGESGWLADQGDYCLSTYVEQLRQLLLHLGGNPVALLGSSLGASASIELVAAHPELISSLILNDTGPSISSGRRQLRSQTLARHYVFRTPEDMLRKTGASQKNDGPVSEEVRVLMGYAQTKWSDGEAGRVYRHDVRAMQAYRTNAARSLSQWQQWDTIQCPVLVIRGMLTDTLSESTVQRMMKKPQVSLMHVPQTGHTPALAEPNHIWCVQQWLLNHRAMGREFSSPYSPNSSSVL